MPKLILAFLKLDAWPEYLIITFLTGRYFITYLVKLQKT